MNIFFDTSGFKMKSIHSGELQIVRHASGNAKYIRDKSGLLFTFRKITKYQGQDERYKREVKQLEMLAEFLFSSLNKVEVE